MPGGLGAFAIVVLAVVVVLALLLVWLLSRDKSVARVSFGFHVERTRYEDEPELPITESWPERKPD